MADLSDTERLLDRAAHGDRSACGELLEKHSPRLRRLIALRLDPRLAARVDPSDVLQETLAVADRRLPGYLRDRPLPFYPWLRRLACDQLAALRRQHIRTSKRSVLREEPAALPDESIQELADRIDGDSGLILVTRAATPCVAARYSLSAVSAPFRDSQRAR